VTIGVGGVSLCKKIGIKSVFETHGHRLMAASISLTWKLWLYRCFCLAGISTCNDPSTFQNVRALKNALALGRRFPHPKHLVPFGTALYPATHGSTRSI